MNSKKSYPLRPRNSHPSRAAICETLVAQLQESLSEEALKAALEEAKCQEREDWNAFVQAEGFCRLPGSPTAISETAAAEVMRQTLKAIHHFCGSPVDEELFSASRIPNRETVAQRQEATKAAVALSDLRNSEKYR
ncbi:hypothetical protein ACHAQJ_008970 [Trichoderma viride]